MFLDLTKVMVSDISLVSGGKKIIAEILAGCITYIYGNAWVPWSPRARAIEHNNAQFELTNVTTN